MPDPNPSLPAASLHVRFVVDSRAASVSFMLILIHLTLLPYFSSSSSCERKIGA
jgi:hypothetical protein